MAWRGTVRKYWPKVKPAGRHGHRHLEQEDESSHLHPHSGSKENEPEVGWSNKLSKPAPSDKYFVQQDFCLPNTISRGPFKPEPMKEISYSNHHSVFEWWTFISTPRQPGLQLWVMDCRGNRLGVVPGGWIAASRTLMDASWIEHL